MGTDIMDLINYMNTSALPLLKNIVLKVPEDKRENFWNEVIESFKKENACLITIIMNGFNACIQEASGKDIERAIKVYKNGDDKKKNNETVLRLIGFMKFSEIYQISAPERLDMEIIPLTYERLLKL